MKRILMFAQDGSGLGHLSRICRIGAELQAAGHTVLIVTGKREAAWMVPETCEFIHVPAWKSIRKNTARNWGMKPWIDISNEDAVKLISDLYLSIADTFNPDVIMNDYAPLGKFRELEKLLQYSAAKKILVLRGIIDESDKKTFFTESDKYELLYDQIFVTNDPKILNFLKEYPVPPTLRSKITSVGYISPVFDNSSSIRAKYQIPDNTRWIVCAAGAGRNADDLFLKSIETANLTPQACFDIILGPYATLTFTDEVRKLPNCRIHHTNSDLGEMLYSADIAVIHGGYNSLVEAISGGTAILVYPNNTEDDEQITHATRLSQYYPLKIIKSLDLLPEMIQSSLNDRDKYTERASHILLNGQKRIRDLI